MEHDHGAVLRHADGTYYYTHGAWLGHVVPGSFFVVRLGLDRMHFEGFLEELADRRRWVRADVTGRLAWGSAASGCWSGGGPRGGPSFACLFAVTLLSFPV